MDTLPSLIRAGCYLLVLSIFLLDIRLPVDVTVGVLYIVAVLITAWQDRGWFTFGIAIISSLLTIAAWLLVPLETDRLWVALANQALAFGAIWTTAVVVAEIRRIAQAREQALRERDEAKEEAKALSGLLPVCAWCKKIRDDSGYWGQVEDYIAKHLKAAPTHGMCPDCTAKMLAEADHYTCTPESSP